MAKKENIVSVLAFEKKLVTSDGYMYGTTWENRGVVVPLALKEKSVRGTISNRLNKAIKGDPQKLNAEVEKANLQRVDACSLEPEQDTLRLDFTLKVLGGVTEPSACNNPSFKQTYSEASQAYIDSEGFKELARRYVINLANGRFLWRNRVGVEAIEVVIHAKNNSVDEHFTFNGSEISTRHFDCQEKGVDDLAQLVANALSSQDEYLLLDISCYAKVGRAQEVYPSEELVLDKSNSKDKKSKILYSVNGIAAMHSQKIGNALRTIDTWYPEHDNPQSGVGPIAIEPYGAVTNLGKAFRTPKEKQDFYTHFDKWARGGKLDCIEEEHYVMAVLVRGGVFGESDK